MSGAAISLDAPVSGAAISLDAPVSGAAISLDALDALFLAVVALVVVWSVTGLTLAEFGFYRPAVFWPVTLAGSVAAVWLVVRSLSRVPRARVARLDGWSIGLLIVVASALFARPGQYLIDGTDGTVYLDTARALVTHHSLQFSEPILDRIGQANWPALFVRDPRGGVPIYIFYSGGVQLDVSRNLVTTGFFHLFPVWIANVVLVAGPQAAYATSVLFGVLSVVAIWMFARRFTSTTAANVAAGLAVLNFTEIWFARFPASEGLAGFFVVSALYCTVVAARAQVRVAGLVAGAAFGLVAATRFDTMILVTPLAFAFLALIAMERAWSRVWTAMAVGLVFTTSQALVHAFTIARSYTLRVFYFATQPLLVSYAGLALPPVLLLALVAWIVGRRVGTARLARWTARGAAVLVAVLAAVRFGPAFVTKSYATFVLTRVGLAAALVGLGWRLVKDSSRATLLVAAVFLVSALIYVESVRDRSAMPFLFRRFLPVVVPVALVFVGDLTVRARAALRRGRMAVFFLPIGIAAFFVRASAPILRQAPMRGVDDQLRAVAAGLPASSLLVTDLSTPSQFALSLHDSFGRDAIAIAPTRRTAAALGDLAASLGKDGAQMWLAEGRGETLGTLSADDFAAVHLEPAGVLTLPHLELETTTTRFPSAIIPVSPEIDFYRVTSARPEPLPLMMDIGDHDAAWRGRGFYPPEGSGSEALRWTRAVAEIRIPRLAPGPATAATMRLRVASPRPADVPAAPIEIAIEGVLSTTTVAIGPAFQTIEVSIDRAGLAHLAAGATRMTLEAPTFVPAVHGSADRRALGVQLDWVRIDAIGPGAPGGVDSSTSTTR